MSGGRCLVTPPSFLPTAFRMLGMTESQPVLADQQGKRGAQQGKRGAQEPVQRGNKWWTLLAVCLGTFMLLLDVTIVNVALPDIQRALNSSFSDLQWIVDAYAL